MAGSTLSLGKKEDAAAAQMDFAKHYGEVHGMEVDGIRFVQLNGMYNLHGKLIRAAEPHEALGPLTFQQEIDRMQALQKNKKLFAAANARAQVRQGALPAAVARTEQENRDARLAEARAG